MTQTVDPQFNPFGVKLNKQSSIKKIIAVVSGKGGVGKSLVSGLMANSALGHGYLTGLLDADVTGPSIGRMYGINTPAMGNEEGLIFPAIAANELRIMTANMLLDDEEKAVMWRGIMINNAIKEFYSKVLWSDLDLLFIDMPPGTGDVPLTVYQSIPIHGIVVVTTPQDLVGMIVAKAIDMAHQMKIPILGIVENMSYMETPNKEIVYPFGKGKLDAYAAKHELDVLAKLPIDATLTQAADQGTFAKVTHPLIDEAMLLLLKKLDLLEIDE
jgi:Mrp family chromosome partitioning ATPase